MGYIEGTQNAKHGALNPQPHLPCPLFLNCAGWHAAAMTGETMLRVLAHRCMQDTDENKLVYTTVFEQYVNIVEHTIDERLKEAVPGFSMQDFSSLLAKHEEQLSADVFDLLLSAVIASYLALVYLLLQNSALILTALASLVRYKGVGNLYVCQS